MSHWYFPVQEPPSLSLGAERWEDSAWVLSGACSQPVQVTRGHLVIAHPGHQGMHRLHQSVLDTGGTHRVGRAVQSLLSPSPLWAVQTTPVAQVLGWDVWYWQMCRAPCQAQGQARADLGYSISKEVKLSCAGTPWNTWGSPGIHADQGVNVWRAGLRRWSGAMVDERTLQCELAVWTCCLESQMCPGLLPEQSWRRWFSHSVLPLWDPTWSMALRSGVADIRRMWSSCSESRATKMIRGLEHLFSGDRLGALKFYCLEKRWFWGDW